MNDNFGYGFTVHVNERTKFAHLHNNHKKLKPQTHSKKSTYSSVQRILNLTEISTKNSKKEEENVSGIVHVLTRSCKKQSRAIYSTKNH